MLPRPHLSPARRPASVRGDADPIPRPLASRLLFCHLQVSGLRPDVVIAQDSRSCCSDGLAPVRGKPVCIG